MQNVVKTKQSVTEDELKKIKEMEWDSYYRETLPSEMQGLTTCSKCNAILIARGDDQKQACYNCGHVNAEEKGSES